MTFDSGRATETNRPLNRKGPSDLSEVSSNRARSLIEPLKYGAGRSGPAHARRLPW